MGEAFPKSARLRASSEFQRVRAEGKTIHGPSVVLNILAGAQPGHPARVGIITSRKVGMAVERSKARRRIREVMRREMGGFSDGAWIVVVAKKRVLTEPLGALRDEVLRAARRASILPGPQ